MRITKHHITNLDLYLGGIADGEVFRVVASLPKDGCERVGLPRTPRAGDTVSDKPWAKDLLAYWANHEETPAPVKKRINAEPKGKK